MPLPWILQLSQCSQGAVGQKQAQQAPWGRVTATVNHILAITGSSAQQQQFFSSFADFCAHTLHTGGLKLLCNTSAILRIKSEVAFQLPQIFIS